MYKVKQSYYNAVKGEDQIHLADVDEAIVQAFRVKDTYNGKDDKNIEEKIEAQAAVIARLLSHLLHDGTLTPETLLKITGYDAEIDADDIVEKHE